MIKKLKSFSDSIARFLRWFWRILWKDKTLALMGIVIGAFGIYLTFDANQKMAQAEALQKISQKATFEATFQKVVFWDNPAWSKNEFQSFPSSKISYILDQTYEDVNSQMENEYLASNSICYKDWIDFRSFLILGAQPEGPLQIMGSENSIADNYYNKIDLVLKDCISL